VACGSWSSGPSTTCSPPSTATPPDALADALAVTVDALLRAFAAVPASTVVRTAPALTDPREVRVARTQAVHRTTS